MNRNTSSLGVHLHNFHRFCKTDSRQSLYKIFSKLFEASLFDTMSGASIQLFPDFLRFFGESSTTCNTASKL